MDDAATDGWTAAADGCSRFAYEPAVLCYGEGATDALAGELAALGRERALVVTGRTVGSTPAVMEPVRAGLGDRLAGEFAETTPEKRLATAVDGAAAFAEAGADAIVAVGGGSSLDVAKAVAAIAASDASTAELAAAFEREETLPVSDDPPPILAVPTTLAGAEQSAGAGLDAEPDGRLVDDSGRDLLDDPVDGGLWAATLHPAVVVYDPALVATTPRSVLAGSAANGFDKGVETLYSRHATPVTDATAARGLSLFRDGLLAFGKRDGQSETDATTSAGLSAAVEGAMLVQYGISRAEETTLGPIHALGQALSAAGDVHQGVAHAVVAPHVLGAIFDRVDGRRDLLAAALAAGGVPGGAAPSDGGRGEGDDGRGRVDDGSGRDVESGRATATSEPAASVVASVEAVRDALDVPTRLRDLEGVSRPALPGVAADAASHRFVDNGPRGFDPTPETFEAVLDAAW